VARNRSTAHAESSDLLVKPKRKISMTSSKDPSDIYKDYLRAVANALNFLILALYRGRPRWRQTLIQLLTSMHESVLTVMRSRRGIIIEVQRMRRIKNEIDWQIRD